MRIDVASALVSVLGTHSIVRDVTDFARKMWGNDRKISVVQFYTDYYLSDGTYPFRFKGYVYYPLTLVFRDGSFGFHWIKWSEKLLNYGGANVFYLNRGTTIESADDVPEEFSGMLAGRRLMRVKKTDHAIVYGGDIEANLGKLNGCFANEAVRQINELLIDRSGVGLSCKWDIDLMLGEATAVVNGRSYRRARLSNSRAECITFGICWDSPCDIYDDISDREVEFQLTDEDFGRRISSIENVAEFIRRGGPVDENNWGAYPKVTFVYTLKHDAPKDAEDRIYARAVRAVEDYNADPKNKYKIKECTVTARTDNGFSLFVDFGRCGIMALTIYGFDMKTDPTAQYVSKVILQ